MQPIRPALVIIDMENGFINSQSPLCIQQARESIPACARTLDAARERGIPVFFVNRVYRANGSDVENTRYHGWLQGGKPMTPGSTGPLSVEIPPEFGPKPGDYFIVKPRFSCFFQTELDLILRRLRVDTVILTGTTTPNCIRTSCYDGISLDYNIAIIEDCCSSNTVEIQQANLQDMRNIGATILTSEEFIRDGLVMANLTQQVREQVAADLAQPE